MKVLKDRRLEKLQALVMKTVNDILFLKCYNYSTSIVFPCRRDLTASIEHSNFAFRIIKLYQFHSTTRFKYLQGDTIYFVMSLSRNKILRNVTHLL